jgi:hypothetical protein
MLPTFHGRSRYEPSESSESVKRVLADPTPTTVSGQSLFDISVFTCSIPYLFDITPFFVIEIVFPADFTAQRWPILWAFSRLQVPTARVSRTKSNSKTKRCCALPPSLLFPKRLSTPFAVPRPRLRRRNRRNSIHSRPVERPLLSFSRSTRYHSPSAR